MSQINVKLYKILVQSFSLISEALKIWSLDHNLFAYLRDLNYLQFMKVYEGAKPIEIFLINLKINIIREDIWICAGAGTPLGPPLTILSLKGYLPHPRPRSNTTHPHIILELLRIWQQQLS